MSGKTHQIQLGKVHHALSVSGDVPKYITYKV